MSQLIVEKVERAMLDAMGKSKSPKLVAKAAIRALRDLPDSTFETMTQKLEFIRVIDNIGKDIATGK